MSEFDTGGEPGTGVLQGLRISAMMDNMRNSAYGHAKEEQTQNARDAYHQKIAAMLADMANEGAPAADSPEGGGTRPGQEGGGASAVSAPLIVQGRQALASAAVAPAAPKTSVDAQPGPAANPAQSSSPASLQDASAFQSTPGQIGRETPGIPESPNPMPGASPESTATPKPGVASMPGTFGLTGHIAKAYRGIFDLAKQNPEFAPHLPEALNTLGTVANQYGDLMQREMVARNMPSLIKLQNGDLSGAKEILESMTPGQKWNVTDGKNGMVRVTNPAGVTKEADPDLLRMNIMTTLANPNSVAQKFAELNAQLYAKKAEREGLLRNEAYKQGRQDSRAVFNAQSQFELQQQKAQYASALEEQKATLGAAKAGAGKDPSYPMPDENKFLQQYKTRFNGGQDIDASDPDRFEKISQDIGKRRADMAYLMRDNDMPQSLAQDVAINGEPQSNVLVRRNEGGKTVSYITDGYRMPDGRFFNTTPLRPAGAQDQTLSSASIPAAQPKTAKPSDEDLLKEIDRNRGATGRF